MDDFSRGYACAVSNLLTMFDQPSIAREVYECNFKTVKELRAIGVEESDIKTLKPIIKEIKNRRKK